MGEEKKIFSIVIPAYNAESTILRTLASLISSRDYIKEVIVVNDHSTDGTIEQVNILKDILPIQILDNEGEQNPGAARKTGLLAAQGEWIAFVDADDCLTASALHYVYQKINKEIVILQTQTIFYEFGDVIPDNIDYNANSCGGRYYRRDFLIDNKLFPHEYLQMAEDEYFNEIIDTFIDEKKDRYDLIKYYAYPTYEVHHDDWRTSFAHGNWVDYVIKYHLLCAQYYTDYFKSYPLMLPRLEREYVEKFIFAYFCLMRALNDSTLIFNINEQMEYFRNALTYYIETFHKSKQDLIKFVNHNPVIIQGLKESAELTIGSDLSPENIHPFKYFINNL